MNRKRKTEPENNTRTKRSRVESERAPTSSDAILEDFCNFVLFPDAQCDEEQKANDIVLRFFKTVTIISENDPDEKSYDLTLLNKRLVDALKDIILVRNGDKLAAKKISKHINIAIQNIDNNSTKLESNFKNLLEKLGNLTLTKLVPKKQNLRRKIEVVNLDDDDDDDSSKQDSKLKVDLDNKIEETVEQRKPSTSKEPSNISNKISYDANVILNPYIAKLSSSLDLPTEEIKKIVQMFVNIINSLIQKNPKYLDTGSFKTHVKFAIEDLENAKNSKSVLALHKNLCDELERLTLEYESDNSDDEGDQDDNNKEDDDQDDKNNKNPKTKRTSKMRPNKKNLRPMIEKLTHYISTLKKKICYYEKIELNEDDLDRENPFTQLPKLRWSLLKAWNKRERLLKQMPVQMTALSRNFEYNGTKNEKFNKIISDYYLDFLQNVRDKHELKNNKSNAYSFFTIEELKNNIQLHMPNGRFDEALILDVYNDLIEENKKRFRDQHCFDYFEDPLFFVDTNESNDAEPPNDEDLEKKLEENSKIARENVQKFKKDIEKKKAELGPNALIEIDVDVDTSDEENNDDKSDAEDVFDSINRIDIDGDD